MVEVETEDEWIDKAEEERLGIIAKYDKGREEGAQIDPWEDPAFEIYHATDFYGFIHDTRLPAKFGADEIKKKNLEVERIDKWLKMFKAWDKYKNSEKLKKRTYKGIPNKLRGTIWSALMDLEKLKDQQPGKYQEMLELARKFSPDIRQIDLDVNRTYRDHVSFRERYGVKQQSLFNILSAYSVYNSEVGYCQGMSQIAALLLLYMNEEESFWALAQLMTHHKYAMHGFFIAGFPKLVRFQSHHDKVLSAMLPKLKKHFDKHGVDSGLYTLKWFFQCFLDRVPYELALRLWDIYLLEGERVLICGAYAILKIHNKNLLAKKNMDDILTYIQSKLPSNFDCDTDTAITLFGKHSEELHRKKLDTAGDPTDEELVKKPFGVIDNILQSPHHAVGNNRPSSSPKKPVDANENTKSRASPQPVVEVMDKGLESTLSPNHIAQAVDMSVESIRPQSDSPQSLDKIISSRPRARSPQYSDVLESSRSSVRSAQSADMQENSRPRARSPRPINVVENSNLMVRQPSQPFPTDALENDRTSPRRLPPQPPQPPQPMDRLDHDRRTPTPRSPRDSGEVFEYKRSSVSPRQPRVDVLERRLSPRLRNPVDVLENSRPSSSSPSPVNIPIENLSLSSPSPLPLSSSSKHIPSGETVRIHVPYNTSTSPSHHSSFATTSGASRNGFDLSKSDPNRIKIDVSSGSGSGILG